MLLLSWFYMSLVFLLLPVGSSSVTTDGYRLPGAGVQRPSNMSTAGAYVMREDRSVGAEMSGNTDLTNVNNRLEFY